MNRHQHRVATPWRQVFASPLVVAVWVLVVAATLITQRVRRVLVAEAVLRREVEVQQAQLVAEEVAAAAVGGDGPASRAPAASVAGARAGVLVAATRVGSELQLRADLPSGRTFAFACDVLDAPAPAVFGRRFALRDPAVGAVESVPEAAALAASDLPAVDEATLAAATAPAAPGLHRDPAIALLHLAAGTDRDDFVLGCGAEAVRLEVPASGVLAVPGNLWIDAGKAPLRLELARDLTLFVDGNLYVGRSLEVGGSGRLLLATSARAGTPFADRDGDGRFSPGDRLCAAAVFAGPAEGAGNVYLGLPGRPPAALELQCGVYAAGELHVGAARVCVHGPLIGAAGLTVLPGVSARLVATGNRLPLVARERVPGFVGCGPSRAGCLRRLGPVPVDAAGEDVLQPLYLGAGVR